MIMVPAKLSHEDNGAILDVYILLMGAFIHHSMHLLMRKS